MAPDRSWLSMTTVARGGLVVDGGILLLHDVYNHVP
jgi:hypothetical protein